MSPKGRPECVGGGRLPGTGDEATVGIQLPTIDRLPNSAPLIIRGVLGMRRPQGRSAIRASLMTRLNGRCKIDAGFKLEQADVKHDRNQFDYVPEHSIYGVGIPRQYDALA